MKHWKAILGVIGIFVLGALAGALLTHRLYMNRVRALARGEAVVPAETIARRIGQRLGLTAEQRARLVPLIADTRQRLNRIRADTEPQVREAFQELEGRIRPLLTPEQQTQFDKLLAEFNRRWPNVTVTPSL